MNTDLKSLAQIAAELELSKQAVYKRVSNSQETIEQLQPHTVTNGTRKYYTLQGQKIIKELFLLSQPKSTEVNQSQPESTTENSEKAVKLLEQSQLKSTEVNQSQLNKVNQSQPESTTKNGAPLECIQLHKPPGPSCSPAPSEGERILHSFGADSSRGTEKETRAAAPASDDLHTIIEALQEQLKIKDNQIQEYATALTAAQEQNKELAAALNNTTAALTAAQALHAGTIQHQLTEHTQETDTATGEPPRDDLTEGERILHGFGADSSTDTESKGLLNKIRRIFKRGKG